MNNDSTNHQSKAAINKFKRVSITLFIVLITGGLMAVVITLSNTLQQMYVVGKPATTDTKTDAGTITLDQTTLDRLNKLTKSNENQNNQSLPSGRINPFAE